MKRIKLDDYKFPLLNRKKEIVGWTVVDEDTYELYRGETSFNLSHGYARYKQIKFHRIILNAKPGEIVDHINSDKLDNRKINLRIVTSSENARNRSKNNGTASKYYGVSLNKRRNKWVSFIRIENKQMMF